MEAQGLTEGLRTETDDVSTWVGAVAHPAEQRLAAYLCAAIVETAERTSTGHVVTHALLSRGCPGERTCTISDFTLPTVAPLDLPPTGLPAVAQWSLYPLLDGGEGDDHMQIIVDAVAKAQARGIADTPAHYATRLQGDLADVLSVPLDAWAEVGAKVPHVVCHLTISVGSPSAPPARG